jgi:capsular exopolysaccharide synthesis family protein
VKRVVKIAENGADAERESSLAEKRVVYTQTRRIDVPAETLKKNRVIVGLDNDAATTSYKMLRTQVLQRMTANGWSSLAVTSPCAGEGKTLTAINLAISLAREVNHTVLLVDADLRRPRISHYFGYTPEFGLYDYLVNDIDLTQIMFNPGIERLVILPGMNSVPGSSELLSAPKMVRLAEELKSRYSERIVLFDMPPLLAADDLLAFSPNIDAALLVVQEGKTKKEELRQAMDLLQTVNVVGTVLNRATEASAAYY